MDPLRAPVGNRSVAVRPACPAFTQQTSVGRCEASWPNPEGCPPSLSAPTKTLMESSALWLLSSHECVLCVGVWPSKVQERSSGEGCVGAGKGVRNQKGLELLVV